MKFTKPLGCLYQIIGGLLLLGGLASFAEKISLIGVVVFLLGVGLLWWGRQAIKPAPR